MASQQLSLKQRLLPLLHQVLQVLLLKSQHEVPPQSE